MIFVVVIVVSEDNDECHFHIDYSLLHRLTSSIFFHLRIFISLFSKKELFPQISEEISIHRDSSSFSFLSRKETQRSFISIHLSRMNIVFDAFLSDQCHHITKSKMKISIVLFVFLKIIGYTNHEHRSY